jgi:hypothetical protein
MTTVQSRVRLAAPGCLARKVPRWASVRLALHPWRAPQSWLSPLTTRVGPSPVHLWGGSFTHSRVKLSSMESPPFSPLFLPEIIPGFEGTGHSCGVKPQLEQSILLIFLTWLRLALSRQTVDRSRYRCQEKIAHLLAVCCSCPGPQSIGRKHPSSQIYLPYVVTHVSSLYSWRKGVSMKPTLICCCSRPPISRSFIINGPARRLKRRVRQAPDR